MSQKQPPLKLKKLLQSVNIDGVDTEHKLQERACSQMNSYIKVVHLRILHGDINFHSTQLEKDKTVEELIKLINQ